MVYGLADTTPIDPKPVDKKSLTTKISAAVENAFVEYRQSGGPLNWATDDLTNEIISILEKS